MKKVIAVCKDFEPMDLDYLVRQICESCKNSKIPDNCTHDCAPWKVKVK